MYYALLCVRFFLHIFLFFAFAVTKGELFTLHHGLCTKEVFACVCCGEVGRALCVPATGSWAVPRCCRVLPLSCVARVWGLRSERAGHCERVCCTPVVEVLGPAERSCYLLAQHAAHVATLLRPNSATTCSSNYLFFILNLQ